MFSQILFPIDFSSSSEAVVPYVRNLAETYRATVHVLHVVADVGADLYVPGEAMVSFISDIRESAEKMMREYCDRHFSNLPNVIGHISEGDPVEEIITFVRAKGDSLIVMATHGRKGLDRVVFGSVAENVVRKSPVPVMTINPYLLIS